METDPNERNGAPSLYPFPEGWYFIASRETIETRRLFRKTWLGEQIVVWCNEDGDVCVADATCPHLGSDLGPEAGGGGGRCATVASYVLFTGSSTMLLVNVSRRPTRRRPGPSD